MTDEPGFFASTNHIQGISLYLKLTPRKPNNIQSFTVAPGLQFIFKALGFQIDFSLTNRVVLDLKPAQRRLCPAAGCPCMVSGNAGLSGHGGVRRAGRQFPHLLQEVFSCRNACISAF